MKRNTLIALISLLVILLLWRHGPIAQEISYHQFADQRSFAGIPNFWDVVSNFPMFLPGGALVALLVGYWKHPALRSRRCMLALLAIGMLLTGAGSAYYHYAPDNHTLVWDRLPMTMIFISFFAWMVHDFAAPIAGRYLLSGGIPLGIFTIWYWQYTESTGAGDLRPYMLVQFLPMLLLPVIVIGAASRPAYSRWLWWVMGWYVLAKVTEHFDRAIFEAGGIWSGHTLKHFFAAVALYGMVRMAQSLVAEHRQ